jgi:hypothetical protein
MKLFQFKILYFANLYLTILLLSVIFDSSKQTSNWFKQKGREATENDTIYPIKLRKWGTDHQKLKVLSQLNKEPTNENTFSANLEREEQSIGK